MLVLHSANRIIVCVVDSLIQDIVQITSQIMKLSYEQSKKQRLRRVVIIAIMNYNIWEYWRCSLNFFKNILLTKFLV